MVQPPRKRITFRVGKKSAPTPAEASEEGTETKKPGDEAEETPALEVVAESPPVADSPSPSPPQDSPSSPPRDKSPPPRLLPAFVLREGSSPLPLSDYDRVRAEAPRLLRGGASTFLRPRRGGASPAPASSSRLLSTPTPDFAYPRTPFAYVAGGGGGGGGGGCGAAAAAVSSPFLTLPSLDFAYAAAARVDSSYLSRFPQHKLAGAASLGLPSAPPASDADAEARRQQLLLVAEEVRDKPPLGEKEPLSVLAANFPADSSVIQEKIKMLNHAFASFRRVRGDGNCFYRSFIISYLEQIAESQDEREVFRIFEHLEELKMGYLSFGEDEERFDDCFSEFRNEVINFLEQRRAGVSLTKRPHTNLDEYKSDAILTFLRLVTSVDMRMREEHFSPFIVDDTNQISIKEYCENEVLPLGVEAEHMQVVALSNAFCIPIRVVYLDSSSGSGGRLTRHDFIPVKYEDEFSDLSFLIDGSSSSGGASSSSSSLPRMPVVVLLYRPGHYDILYPK